MNVDEDGQFDTYFYVPDELTDGEDDEVVYGGTYYVYITYDDDDEIVTVTEFTVIAAEIELYPDEGSVGTEVEITGIDFADHKDITVEFDNYDLDIESGDDETDNDGEFKCTVIIPEVTAGEHTVTVIDDSGTLAEAYFTVEPEIIVSTDRAEFGDLITISGTGFSSHVDVTIEFDGDEVITDETDDDGEFECTVIIPEVTAGEHTVTAIDDSGILAEAYFTGKPEIIVNTDRAEPGDSITVSGTSFGSYVDVTIEFDGEEVITDETDGDGSFQVSFAVPIKSSGICDIKAEDDDGNEAEINFTIAASVQLSQPTRNTGDTFAVDGSGFTPNASVTITLASEQITASTDASGWFSVNVTVPCGQNGPQPITTSDGINTVTTTFTVESTPPQIPLPLLPAYGDRAKSQAYFDWDDVLDPSFPVTYTLQVTTSESFATIVLEKTGLTESEYTLTEGEKLNSTSKEAPYYWRVQAVDGAGNESGWTTVGPFYVGFPFNIPGWALYTLIGLIAGLLIVLITYVLVLIRRSRTNQYYPEVQW